MSLKALNHPYENYTGIFDAINAADELGISILNISLVVEESDSILYDFIQAINNYSGLIVCGAGNDGRDLDNMTDSYNVYPPEYSTEHDNLITVGATSTSDQLASYSNHSDTFVNICAPGGLLSCYPLALCGYTMHSDSHHDYGYHGASGTSFAAPFVTGVAALMLVEDPTLEAEEIKEIILEEADKLSNLTQYCEDGNRLNAYAAVAACHTHHFFYNKTATTHTGTCPCGATTGTMFHSWGTNLDGTRVCTICVYYRAAQIVSIPHYETE